MKLFPYSRFIVKDRSMEPFLRHGDHVLTFNWRRPKVGDVVVFEHSPDKKTYYVKRIKKVSGQSVFVEGDNKKLSSKLGPIKIGQIVGKVVLKY